MTLHKGTMNKEYYVYILKGEKMNASQKAAGIGAFFQGVFFVNVLILIFAVLPRFGLQGPSDFADPAKVRRLLPTIPLMLFGCFLAIYCLRSCSSWQS